jgi:hypothetical protein
MTFFLTHIIPLLPRSLNKIPHGQKDAQGKHQD